MGMNEAGVTLDANSLVSERDLGEDGVPFHVMLRALIGTPTISEALRSCSARVAQGRATSCSDRPQDWP